MGEYNAPGVTVTIYNKGGHWPAAGHLSLRSRGVTLFHLNKRIAAMVETVNSSPLATDCRITT